MGNKSKITAGHIRSIRLVIGLSLVFLIPSCGSNSGSPGSLPTMGPTPIAKTSNSNPQTQSPKLTIRPTVPVKALPTAAPTATIAKTPTPTATATVAPPVAPTPTGTPAPMSTVAPVPKSRTAPPDFSAPTSYPAFSETLNAAFSKALEEEFEAATPKMGISAAVYQNGLLWTQALGMANESTLMTPTTPLRVMSTSRTFVGALVLSQIEDGLYGLNDRLSTLLAGHNGYQSSDTSQIPDATVEELLTMTAGIIDVPIMGIGPYMIMTAPSWEKSDMLGLMNKPHAPPGTFLYGNDNTYLLGLIAEHMAGNDLNELLQAEFLEPLSLKAALLPEISTPSGIATPYGDRSQYGGTGGFGNLSEIPMYSKIPFIEADSRVSWPGASAVSTAENMARWAYELYSLKGSAVTPEVRSQQIGSFRPETISLAAAPQKYGFHIARKEHLLSDGTYVATYGHPGGGAGYASALFYAPSLDLAVSILSNTDLGQLLGTCASYAEHWLGPFDCITRKFLSAVVDQP
jgi:CubicO group peptidase (beta-lactamase class C family)